MLTAASVKLQWRLSKLHSRNEKKLLTPGQLGAGSLAYLVELLKLYTVREVMHLAVSALLFHQPMDVGLKSRTLGVKFA